MGMMRKVMNSPRTKISSPATFVWLGALQNKNTETPTSPENVTTNEETRQRSDSRGVGKWSFHARKCASPYTIGEMAQVVTIIQSMEAPSLGDLLVKAPGTRLSLSLNS